MDKPISTSRYVTHILGKHIAHFEIQHTHEQKQTPHNNKEQNRKEQSRSAAQSSRLLLPTTLRLLHRLHILLLISSSRLPSRLRLRLRSGLRRGLLLSRSGSLLSSSGTTTLCSRLLRLDLNFRLRVAVDFGVQVVGGGGPLVLAVEDSRFGLLGAFGLGSRLV